MPLGQILTLGQYPENRETVVVLPREQALPIALRALRETLNYSQQGWAILMGVSWRTVMRWEQGRALPAEHTLIMLRCRLSHEHEARMWQQRLLAAPDVYSLLVNIGLIDDGDRRAS